MDACASAGVTWPDGGEVDAGGLVQRALGRGVVERADGDELP
jgi:hypothetical protein